MCRIGERKATNFVENKKQKIMAKFRKVEMSIRRGNGYGIYLIEAKYKGVRIVAPTTNSEIFDWLEDDSLPKKHLEAKRAAYYTVIKAYEISKKYQNRKHGTKS